MELLSAKFLLFALLIVLAMSVARGALRYGVFLASNVYFASSFLNPAGMVAIATLCLSGYAFARWIVAGNWQARYVGPAFVIVVFVYFRGYGFIETLLPGPWTAARLAPAGLSFLFFKILHVLIDASAGTLGKLQLGTYLNYCLNFTTFLLGPIQRYQDFLQQWQQPDRSLPATFESHLEAVNRILRGLVKKFVFAEFLAAYALRADLDVQAISMLDLLSKTYIFYFNLYCDFSGYCDIMIGIGSLLGIRPPENFWLPFFSRNVAEFWLRVHRSLTLWLTDYVFNPCYASALRARAFSANPLLAMSVALMATMLMSGLWHGTTLSFLWFGLLHGIFLVVFRTYEHVSLAILGRRRFQFWSQKTIVTVFSTFLTFHVTALAYVFFVLDEASVGLLWQRFLSHLI